LDPDLKELTMEEVETTRTKNQKVMQECEMLRWKDY